MRKRFASLVLLAASIAGIYAIAALITFDFGEPAFPFDEENFQGQRVALGPRPRHFVCPPPYHNFFWVGNEWPFRLFSPVCAWWRERYGFVPSSMQR